MWTFARNKHPAKGFSYYNNMFKYISALGAWMVGHSYFNISVCVYPSTTLPIPVVFSRETGLPSIMRWFSFDMMAIYKSNWFSFDITIFIIIISFRNWCRQTTSTLTKAVRNFLFGCGRIGFSHDTNPLHRFVKWLEPCRRHNIDRACYFLI